MHTPCHGGVWTRVAGNEDSVLASQDHPPRFRDPHK